MLGGLSPPQEAVGGGRRAAGTTLARKVPQCAPTARAFGQRDGWMGSRGAPRAGARGGAASHNLLRPGHVALVALGGRADQGSCYPRMARRARGPVSSSYPALFRAGLTSNTGSSPGADGRSSRSSGRRRQRSDTTGTIYPASSPRTSWGSHPLRRTGSVGPVPPRIGGLFGQSDLRSTPPGGTGSLVSWAHHTLETLGNT